MSSAALGATCRWEWLRSAAARDASDRVSPCWFARDLRRPARPLDNFPPGVSGFAVTPLQGNPDGHGNAPIRQ
jgi:hypothetical protein